MVSVKIKSENGFQIKNQTKNPLNRLKLTLSGSISNSMAVKLEYFSYDIHQYVDFSSNSPYLKTDVLIMNVGYTPISTMQPNQFFLKNHCISLI